MPAVMAGWDIFVLPSLDEGFGVAALEAMSAGLPVIASAVGGLCELVENGETGWLVSAAVPAEIAQRIRELVQDPHLREIMGIAGRQRALRNFTISRMVEQTIAVYDKLSASKFIEGFPYLYLPANSNHVSLPSRSRSDEDEKVQQRTILLESIPLVALRVSITSCACSTMAS
jgi:hypothetical protein